MTRPDKNSARHWWIVTAINKMCQVLIPVFLLIAFCWILYDTGFNHFQTNDATVNYWLSLLLPGLVIMMGLRWLAGIFEKRKLRARLISLGLWLITICCYVVLLPLKRSMVQHDSNLYLLYKILLYTCISFVALAELSLIIRFSPRKAPNSALLFVASFALMVLLGTLLLSLPYATHRGLSLTDALFTSTSAVCVTGLAVTDTAREFTVFGQVILLLLIQAGGLGIMTFTGLLSYAITGSISFRNELAFRNMFLSNKLGNVMHLVSRIVLVTFFFEAIGAAGIYFTTGPELFERKLDKLFFSVFHSVSAFCNAGFSTYSNGLYHEGLRFNYSFQLLIALLIILGGLGFPITFNLFSYIRVKATNGWWRLQRRGKRIHIPRLININSRLALVTSFFLLVTGFIAYLAFEWRGTLQQHPSLWGKMVTAFFGSVTPRTAGFDTVNISGLNLSTVMIYLLLMWIGASPGSTGGGIKTTTFAVAVLNMTSVVRGKDRSEFFNTEISAPSVRRAFAIMLLSLLVIGIAVFLISIRDGDKGLIQIAFEAFSAFSTVGLTLGITPELSGLSKLVLVLTMFIGRVGTLTLIMAFVKQQQQLYYRYPKEDITF
ncbi:TrkH family potassium uptake protein [Chitinophaga japonensis]|uniref:Potassium uptake TrkH family protein n=1 Tax=Chitinophaga japonensis TaxID=104662 RepID=A0A562SZD1_CHIJA|nr:potassium transporter TrkG [Chitinophaga japonensis]TWI86398.1 potassium uptake TrkH family protein [Chitinophaga japonensis]